MQIRTKSHLSMAKKSHSYQPPKKLNPLVFARQIEDLEKKVGSLEKHVETVVKSYNVHMDYIANFARHDLGNAIQNIAATIRLIEDQIDPDALESLKASVEHLDTTLANLGDIIHSNPDEAFQLNKLMRAVEVFVRSSLAVDNISIEANFDVNDKNLIHQPFQTLLQLIHNLIINAKKAINKLPNPTCKRIVIDANIIDKECVISVKDTGCGIPDELTEKIFEFGFTTTSGSGIGLYHAKNVCDEIGGKISLTRNSDGFATIFTIKFPIDGNEEDTCD